MTAPLLDLTGGRLNIRVNKGDGEAFDVPLPADLTGWTFTCTGGVTVSVTTTKMTVRVPAAVTAVLLRPTGYVITCRYQTGEPTTLLSGQLIPA